MVAYVTAGSDPGHYGQLTSFQFPPGENLDAPSQVRSLINADPAVSQQLTLLSQKGSDVLFGDLLVVPIENGFLYAQPVFVVAAGNPIPELKRVVVVHGGNASIATTLTDAIALSFGQTPVQPPPSGGGGPPPTTQVGQLLAQAQQHFAAAEAALKAGDLATYQKEIDAGIALVNEAEQAAASPSPSPTPSASPSG